MPGPVPVPVSQQGVIIRSRTCYTVTRGCIVNFMAAAADAEKSLTGASRQVTNEQCYLDHEQGPGPASQTDPIE